MKKLIQITILATTLFTTQGQAMETGDQQTLVDDDIFITIRNEHSEKFPVRLRLNIISYNDPHPKVIETEPTIKEVFNVMKVVMGRSTSHFKKSECTLFIWHLNAYNAQKPDKCDFLPDLIFNGVCYKPDKENFNTIDHGAVVTLSPSFIPYGQTYVIKPRLQVDHTKKLAASFEIEQID